MTCALIVSVRLVEAEKWTDASTGSQFKVSLSDSENLAVYSSSGCILTGPCKLPETRKRPQSEFPASTSLPETTCTCSALTEKYK